ncbi:MAG: hypothetical protein Q8Q62_21070 [Mesorhizobium sp.]|nr:hypothetical protein [Mesorhizobium sp.]
MRIDSRFLHSLPLAAAVVLGAFAGSAMAGDSHREKVHADSFGNLVIYSPAGYKRIVVGAGYLAEELRAAQAGIGQPEVVYYEDDGHDRPRIRCNRKPVLLHGRSHMYGLPDNVVPTPAGNCD